LGVFKRFPTPPTFDDYTLTYAARLLHWSLIVLTITESLAFVFLLVSGLEVTLTLPLLILLNLVVFYLLHRRRLQWAGRLFVGMMWSIVTLNSFSNRGVESPIVVSYVLIIMLSAILLHERGVIVITVLSILAVIVMVVIESQGIITFPVQVPVLPETLVIAYVIIFAVAGTLVYITARSIRKAYNNLRRSEDQLVERNRQLERQIEERQRAEAERDHVFELSVDMMAIATTDGYFKRVNPAFEHILGYSPDELLSQPFLDLIHPDDVERTLQEIANLQAGDFQPVFENRYRRKDGSYRWLSWTTRSVGQYLYAVARDVTEQKLAEKRERELLLVKEKNQFLSEFLSTVSHDLKTPLSVINTNLYLLERIQDPIKQHDKIEHIKEQTALVEKFIQDILTVTRLDHLPGLNLQPLDLNRMLSDIAHQFRSRAETKLVELRLDLTQDLPLVSGDADQLQRAFANLVDNGLNYTPQAGAVDIRTFREADTIAVEIQDTGIGIPEADLPHIFDRFYRSDEARVLEQGGTGLGLAIVKKVMDMHGYEILVLSSSGHGTTFRAQIPIPAVVIS
jgi:PAS domain S-box-containing protein